MKTRKASLNPGSKDTPPLLHGVPKGFPVCVLRRGVGWQQD